MENVITLSLLKKYTAKLSKDIPLLERNTAYNIGDITKKKGFTLKCKTAGTTDTKELNLSTATEGSILADGTATWAIINPYTILTEWQAGKEYFVGDVVLYNNAMYKCIAQNNDSTFVNTNFEPIGGNIKISSISNEFIDTLFAKGSVKPAPDEPAPDEPAPMYGVLFEPNSTMGTRTYDAAGLTWNRSSNTVEGIDNFKNIAPFKTRECCRIWDDAQKKATYVYKDDYTDEEWKTIREGTHASIEGDIMIEVNEFWYRRVQREDKKFEIIVAPKYKAGFKPDPWHYVNGKHYEKRYISKYKLSGDFKSLSGQLIRTETTLNTARTALQAKGMNELTFQARYSLVMLMLVKYATTNVKAIVAKGHSEFGLNYTTGSADNVKGLDGSATAVTATESALALGIEDFWGRYWSYIDGAVCYEGKIYFKDADTIQTDPTVDDLASWTPTTSTYPNSDDKSMLITAIANDADYDWLFTPSADSNATTQTTNDNFWSMFESGLTAPVVGGCTWSDSPCGLFTFACMHTVGISYVLYGFCAIA